MHLPMVRMTNTFVLDGTADPDDIIAATDTACMSPSSAAAASTPPRRLRVRYDRGLPDRERPITEPLRDGNLIGNGPQVLRDIDMLGNDFAMGSPGTCGKDGQGVPVGDGQPTLRVKSLTVGGTAA